MSVTVSTENNVFLLSTASTSYAFGVDDRGLLRHLYWGKKLPSAEELEVPSLTEVSTNDPVFEITPEEFPVHGGLRYKEHCLKAAFADGTRELVYQYCGYDVEQGENWEKLVVHLKDDAYYSVMYILWGMTYTVMDIPYWSMLPSLSSTQQERESMSVIPRIFASSAWLLMGAFGLKLISVLGEGDTAKGYASLAVVIAAAFVGTILITVIFVRDRSSLEAATGKKAQRISLKEAIHVITANDQLKVYIGVVLAYNMLVQLAGGMALYYFKYVTGDEDLFPYFTTAASVAEIIALFAFPVLSRFMSKKQVFAVASFTPAVGLIALIVFGLILPTNIPLIIVCGLFFKFGSGLTLGATTVMLADVIDYGEVKLGTRNESIVASFQTLLVKTASAVAGWLIGVGLTIVGYVQNVPQTETTIWGMRILMGVIPSIVTVLAFVIYVKSYKLEGSYLEEITRQLAANKKKT